MSNSNIKRLRLQYGLTQTELAKIAGVTDKAVCNWESGLAEPRMGSIEKIAKHFNLKKSELIDEQDTPFIDKETMLFAMEMRDNPDMQILFHAAQGVSKEDLQAAVEIIKRLKK